MQVPSYPGGLLRSAKIPMPPVIFTMQDYDESNALGLGRTAVRQDIGTVIVKHTDKIVKQPDKSRDGELIFQMLDFREDQPDDAEQKGGYGFVLNPGPLDLNKIHEPFWHALDQPARTPFDCSAGGVELSWLRRPRMLLAVGYSMQKEMVANSVCEPLISSIQATHPDTRLWRPDYYCYYYYYYYY